MQSPRTQITIRDIADRLGISHSTVSRALRDSPLIGQEMKDRVKQTANRLGYVPDTAARTMRGERSSLVGLILPDVRPDFFSGITTAFGLACAARGFNLMLAVSQGDAVVEEAHIRALRGARVAGVLIYPTASLSAGSVRLLSGVPTVQVVRRHPELTTSFVGTDDAASMATLVRHLVDLGHRRIGYIGSDPRFSPGLDRLKAFRSTMQELGCEVDEALVRTGAAVTQIGSDAARSLLELSPPPTALTVASAPLAEGVLDVLQRKNLRVPEDVSLTSFGDPYWYRSWRGGITTVAMPIKEVAETALSLLLDTLNDKPEMPPEVVCIPSHVVLRRTTAPPASA